MRLRIWMRRGNYEDGKREQDGRGRKTSRHKTNRGDHRLLHAEDDDPQMCWSRRSRQTQGMLEAQGDAWFFCKRALLQIKIYL